MTLGAILPIFIFLSLLALALFQAGCPPMNFHLASINAQKRATAPNALRGSRDDAESFLGLEHHFIIWGRIVVFGLPALFSHHEVIGSKVFAESFCQNKYRFGDVVIYRVGQIQKHFFQISDARVSGCLRRLKSCENPFLEKGRLKESSGNAHFRPTMKSLHTNPRMWGLKFPSKGPMPDQRPRPS